MSSSPRLTEWQATAIAGNNILSTVFYVSGMTVVMSGVFAPILLVIVAIILAAFRSIYMEIVGLIPANGGAYQALLNATSKPIAAAAGSLTLLSYITTAAISALAAMSALQAAQLLPSSLSILTPAVGLILTVTVLTLGGVRDSARMAAWVFGLHLFVIISLALAGIWFGMTGNFEFFPQNLEWTLHGFAQQSSALLLLFPAFGIAFLSISGLESVSSYVENLELRQFPRVLKNLFLASLLANPLIASLILHAFPISALTAHPESAIIKLAELVGSPWFATLVSIDAALVLTGAILASFVGASDLLHRMSEDRLLPSFLRHPILERATRTSALACGVLVVGLILLTSGKLAALASVYALSFLGTMTLLGASVLILRRTRPEMHRPHRASLIAIGIGLIGSALGSIGALLADPESILPFSVLFFPLLAFTTMVMFKRDLLGSLLPILEPVPLIGSWMRKKWESSVADDVVVFIRDHGRLWSILDYIRKNENTWNITFVHCHPEDDSRAHRLAHLLRDLQEAGFLPHLQHRIVHWPHAFSPEAVSRYRSIHGISPGRVFMGSIHHGHPYSYEDFQGVRIIF